MTMSYTITETETFSVSHARKLASKAATDLKRLQWFYTAPDDAYISRLEAEAAAFIKAGYFKEVMYGFKRSGKWVVALKYQLDMYGNLTTDDNPGRIGRLVDVTGATFYTYMIYSDSWWALTGPQREAFVQSLPIQRGDAPEPAVENGYWMSDRTYAAGGRGLARSSIRSY
jgi:hypothetical protein